MRAIVRYVSLLAVVAVVAAPCAREAFAQTVSRFEWSRATPEEMGMDRAKLEQARRYSSFDNQDPHAGGSGLVIRGGKLVMAWGDSRQLYQIKSATKSVAIAALGLAIQDGRVRLDDRASRLHNRLGVPPESNVDTGWLPHITLEQLATHTSGFDRGHGYEKLVFEPGTMWAYSDGGPDWLGECLTLEYRRDMSDLLFERVFTPLGIGTDDLRWRSAYNRPELLQGIKRREFGSGIRANVDALARIGQLYLKGGLWEGRQLVPRAFVERARTTAAWMRGLPLLRKGNPEASQHYGLLWWNNSDSALKSVPTDAFWAWGGMQGRDTETLLVVIPSLDIVAVRVGTGWGDGTIDYRFLEPFIAPIAEAVVRQSPPSR